MKLKYIITSLCFTPLFLITTQAQANQLNSAAKQKIQTAKINLDALLTNESNDLIIEFKDNNISSTNNTNVKETVKAIAANKNFIKKDYSHLLGLTVLRDYNGLPISVYRINNKDTLIKVLNNPNIAAVYPNIKNQINTMESLPLIQQPEAAENGYTGANTSVVVADTGVNYRHADFGSCITVNRPVNTCRVIRAFDTAPNDWQLDANGHGTNVAAIVAKVAAETKIIGIDVFRGLRATDSDIIAAINWSINNAGRYNIKAVNLSLGASIKHTAVCQSSYTTPFARLRNANIIPVVASGNDRFTDGIATPACTAGAVSVGAVYDSNMGTQRWSSCTDRTDADRVTCFSNSSNFLTLLAPGAMITAGGYTQGGTSQATPHVAGAIAVLRADDILPQENINQTITRLQDTGTRVVDHRNGLEFRRINLLAATQGLEKSP